MNKFIAYVGGSLLTCAAITAHAIDAASGQVSVIGGNGASVTDPTSATLGGGTINLIKSPTVSLTAQITSPVFGEAQGTFGVFTYYFTVVGGSPSDSVPVLVATNLQTSALSASGYGFAAITVGSAPEQVVCINGAGACTGPRLRSRYALTLDIHDF